MKNLPEESELAELRTVPALEMWWNARTLTIPREDFLLNRGISKKLREEVFPAIIFLKEKYKNRPCIRYRSIDPDNIQVDGQVFEGSTCIELIQCTYAKDGNLEKHQMKEFIQEGFVFLNTKPTGYAAGQRFPKNQKLPQEMAQTDSIIAEVLALIANAIQNKIKKSYATPLTLLVAFEFTGADLDKFIHEAETRVRNDLSNNINLFREIWLVSTIRTQKAQRIL